MPELEKMETFLFPEVHKESEYALLTPNAGSILSLPSFSLWFTLDTRHSSLYSGQLSLDYIL
ncbi:hypothetical protein E2C01_020359 [Portunus trituberculatus]|uniref:Uncharacterized protein n=1 Tax=Portunus trituberculatus TaxID=210409 RepID=A0A5B7E1T0_PORTR|nr:hypothetical protein [Portunus trituberculatus]